MAQHKQQKRSKKNAPKHARVSDVSKNSPSLGVVASVALASTLAIAPFSAAHALEAAASQAPDTTDNAPTPQSKAPAKAAAPHTKQVSYTVRDSDSNILPPLSVFAVDTKKPSPEETRMAKAVAESRSAATPASGEPDASTPAPGSGSQPAEGSQPTAGPQSASGSQPASSSQPAPTPSTGGTSPSSPSTPTGAPDASTNKNAVITPNTNNTEANTQEGANAQVKREEDKKKTYTFTVSYCVEGYHQKQLLQPTEFTFTDDELTKISDPNEQGLYIPVEETPGYRAQRGKYIKDGDKYVLDKTKDASVRSYIKIDRTLVEANINNITSTETNKIAHYFIEYRPKTITYYVRHMLQDSNNPDNFVEFTGINEQITITDKQGQSQTIRVSKAKGVVGQNLYAQPVTIEGYTPEPNLVNSPIPDDDAYADADADDPSSANNKKKYLVLELRYLLNKHEVSYDTQGGTAIQSKVFYYGMKVDAVPEPTRKGYVFDGWTCDTQAIKHAPLGAGSSSDPSYNPATPNKDPQATLIQSMPDANVHFVAHWKPASQHAQYHINIWVQKADLPKPKDLTNMDNYDFIGQVKKEGKSDGIIQDADLNLTDDQIAHLAWPDKNLRGNIENQADFDKYFMEDKASEARTKALNKVEEPEYFGAKKMRALTKIRPDGTTVVNKVFNRRVYELIFANPDIVKDGTSKKLFDSVDHITITKGGKEYNDTDKDKLYKVTYRFGQTIHYTSRFPTDTETKRYQTADDSTPLFGLGWRVANDAGKIIFIDTPPYRFDEKHFIAPQKDNKDFSQDNIRLFGEKLTPYQRVLVPDANNNGAGSIHVLVKLETEESARRNDDNNREYVVSELSYTKDDTLSSEYNYEAPTIEGFEAVNKTQKIEEQPEEDEYYGKLAEELADIWEKDHPGGEQPDDDDDEFKNWVAQKFPHLVFTSDGSNGTELEKNGLLIFEYKRKNVSVRFNIDEITQVKDSSGKQASTQEPYGANVRKFSGTYNEGVTKNPLAAGKHFASSYTFTLNGKTYTFSRPDSLPEDYEFAGWSLDPAGTNKLATTKANGEAYTAQEIADLLDKKSPEEITNVLGSIPLETNGITLYASWKRVAVVHKLDVDMGRDDVPDHTEVFVKHGAYAKKERTTVQDTDSDKKNSDKKRDYFPAVADRPGYIFNGWMQQYIKPDGTKEWLPFAFSSPILEDLHIKAQWIEDKRVSGTMSHVFLREGYTAEDYKKAKADNNQEELKKMVADIQTNVLTNLRPRSSYAAEAVYRSGNYYPDHTYSTFMVSEDEKENNAEFVYTPYAIRRFTVHYKDAAGNELADPETFVSNKLEYDVAHAKVIPGYRLPNDKPLARQLHFKPNDDGSYEKNYDIDFIYDDVRILKRKDNTQVTPDNYSRVQFDTQTTELTMENGKVKSNKSNVEGGDLSPYNGTETGDTHNPTRSLTFDVVKGIKAYEAPLPTPHAKEGYTFTGWTSKVVFAKGETSVDGANRLPVYSEEFPYKVVYTAHFTKTQIAFVGGDTTTEAPEGYYKVTYSADQNGRLSRQISDDQGGTKTETLDTLINVVVIDKYKDNVIEAPVAVPDKGFEEKGDFEFKGRDAKDRTYIKHFEMIEPKAVEKRYILPGHLLLKENQSAKDLIANNNSYADADDNETGARAATYEFCDEHGNQAFLDTKTPGEHKIFIKVTAGREKSRISKMVPFFYEVMPQLMFGKEFNAKGYPAEYANKYKKITFTSHAQQGVLTGKDKTSPQGESETLETYVYTGDKAPENYRLDLPSATGKDYTQAGYHWVFRGWRIVGEQPQPDVTDFKTFKPDILPQARYEQITRPTGNIIYQAVYEKIPYITQQTDNGNVPPDSVVVSFKPAAGRAWKDGKTGPKVLYIKKGMDISKLDEHGVPIKPGETKKSILQVLGDQLYGYTGDWTKSSMEGIDQIDSMQDHGKALPAGTADDAWLSNNAFQEFVAHQTQYTDPVGGVEKTIIQGTKAPAAIDFVKNADLFKPADGAPFESITAEYVEAPSTDAAANLTVPIKVTVKYKDSAETTHTRVYNITGALHVLGDVLEKKDAPTEQTLKDQYTTITFVSKKQKVVDASGQETGQTEEPGQVSGATEGTEQSELQYLAYKKDDANYTITIPQVAGKDYEANGYHYVFTGWKKVQSGAHAQEVLLNANQRTLSFDAQENVIYEAQYKKVPYVVEKSDDGTVPPDSVVVSFKPAAGRAWKDGKTGPKVLYIKKGVDISKIDEHGKPVTDEKQSILAWLGNQLYGYTDDWTKSSMEGIDQIDSMQKHGAGLAPGTADDAWKSNNAFQEFVAHQTAYTDPVGGVEKTIIKGTEAPAALDFVQNKDAFVPSETSTVESITAEYVKAPSTDAAANLTVPIKVTVKYKDSAETTHTREYNITGALHVLGDVLEKKDAPTEQTLKDQYTTITFVSKKQKVVDASGQETGQTEEPGQVSGATEGTEQSELEYLTFKKDGASYTIDVPKVSGKDYTENGYHYVFTGWKQVVTPASGVTPVTIGAADRNYTFDAKQNIVFEAQYKKVPYVVEKSDDGTVPPDSVVVSFKPAAGRAWKDGKTGPKVLYIKKGVDISKIDEHGKPVTDEKQSILAWLGNQLYGYTDDWTKSSMEGIDQIDSMTDHGKALPAGTADDAWKSNNAFQEFVAHQTPYTDPVGGVEKTIIKGTEAPAALDFVQNKDAFVPSETSTVESITAEYVKAPSTDAAANLTVPIKVTVKYKDSAETTHTRVYNITGALHVLGDVLEKKNAPADPELTSKYTTITFVSKKQKVVDASGQETGQTEEPGQVSGATEGTEQSELEYLTFKKDGASYTIDVPKVSGKDYTENGYHYVFTGWKQVVTPASGVTPVTIGAADRNYTFDAKQNIVFEAQYKKVPYIVTKVTDGTIPEDSVVVSFKPAPGRKWADGSTGPKVLYIKKGMDISRLDKNGVPIKDTDTTTQSILQVLGSQLAGYENDWSKSSMDGITLIDSMQKHGAGLAPGTADEAWKSNNAFQEFVAHQTPYVEPEAVSEFTIAQNDTVPTLEEFVKNLAQLKGNNIALDDQGKPIFKIETIGKMPTSKVAATYTIPWTVTLKHADMSDTITYKCTTVLRVMSDVYNATDAENMIKDITASETPDKQGKTTPLTPAQQKFKDSYARVVFKSYDKDKDKGTVKGTLSGGDNDTTLTRYVKINTDVDLSIPGVNPKQKLDDHDGNGEYDYLFDYWEIQVKPTGEGAGASNGESAAATNGEALHAAAHKRSKRSVDVFPQTMLFAANGAGADAPTEGTTVVAGATNETLAASLRRLKRQFDQTYPNVTYEIIARYKKVYYVIAAKDANSIPAGFVPVVAFPAPGHTWENGSVDPDIYYVKSGESYGAKRQEWEKGLANLKGWKYLGADGKVITDPQVLASIDKPTKALTLIAQQYDLPELKPKNDLVITEGDTMPSYNEMVEDDGVKTFTTLKLNPRFAGWKTNPDSYAALHADKPGIYKVHFDLNYYTDEQEIDPQTKKPLYENGKVKHKVAVKRVNVNVHVLPRVIAAQNAPADGTPEDTFIKKNYTKVMYRVAMGDHGFLASPYTTFYVRRGYTIDPNALLYFDKKLRAERAAGNEEIGVPSAIAQPGYVFYDWQKVDANEKGDVVYLARFRKLPIAHFMLETSTEAEQPFSTRLVGDAQNHPIYKPKPDTKLPDGVTVTCDGATCTISGTPHISDWKPGETERVIELRFEAVDQRVTYDEHGKEQPATDKYGRSSYGIQKEIVVKLVVKKPPEKTDDGAGSGGGYWYPKDGRYNHEPERSIVREVPGSKGGDQLAPASDQAPADAQSNARPAFENGIGPDNDELPGICSTASTSDKGCYYAGERAPRHAKESLPKTSDVPSRPLLELVAGSGIALIGTAFIAKRKKKNKHTK